MPNLILKRRIGEKLTIGSCVKLTVVDIRGYVVTLSIEAPRAISILRADAIVREPTAKAVRE